MTSAAFAGIADHDGFRVDLVSYPMFGEDVDGVFREFARYDTATYHGGFRFGGRKLFMDGSPAGTHRMAGPNRIRPARKARATAATLPWISMPPTGSRWRRSTRAISCLCHCNGDAASDAYLDLVERAMHESTNPRKRELKPVMVHCQFARRDQYERMRTLGVIPSIFVAHTWYWGDTHIANMGMGRASEISRVHDALELGLPFTFHTDSPVIETEPVRIGMVRGHTRDEGRRTARSIRLSAWTSTMD